MASITDQTYTGVRASLGDWLHRADLTNTDYGNFVFLFEKDFNTRMRMRNMVAQTTIGITAGYLPNPTDWQQWKSITRVQGQRRVSLDPLSEESANVDFGEAYMSFPKGYVVRGDKTIIYPAPGAGAFSYEGVYYMGVPSLAAAGTNWLMNAYPQAYLFGSLLWAQSFTKDAEVAAWDAVVEETLSRLKTASSKQEQGGGIMRARPDRVV